MWIIHDVLEAILNFLFSVTLIECWEHRAFGLAYKISLRKAGHASSRKSGLTQRIRIDYCVGILIVLISLFANNCLIIFGLRLFLFVLGYLIELVFLKLLDRFGSKLIFCPLTVAEFFDCYIYPVCPRLGIERALVEDFVIEMWFRIWMGHIDRTVG